MDNRIIWIIEAEEACDSSAGGVTLLLITPDRVTLPDVLGSYRRVRNRDSCSICQIKSVRQLGSFQVEGFLLIDGID